LCKDLGQGDLLLWVEYGPCMVYGRKGYEMDSYHSCINEQCMRELLCEERKSNARGCVKQGHCETYCAFFFILFLLCLIFLLK
jgi:hypothetical protein